MKEELLYRYLYGQTTESENKRILKWLDADPVKHTAKLSKLHYICTAVDHYQSNLLAISTQEKKKRWQIRTIGRYAVGVVASVLILIGTWHLANQSTYNKVTNRLTTLEVPVGQYFKIVLEDGTNVWLNSESTLEYPPVFGKKNRKVKLSGEAMFDVQHHAKWPFIVETFTSEIEVMGTKFNVIADKSHNLFSTTLVEGKIKVTNLHNPAEFFLMQPYDVISLNGKRLYKTQTSDFADLCWTEGLIHIKKMPFDLLMLKLEKAYGVKIIIRRKEMPEINVMSGEIRVSDGIDNALHILQRLSDFTYTRNEEKNVIEIR